MKKPGIELKKHASKPASKWYLAKLVLYITILVILGIVFVRKMNQNKTQVDQTKIKEIEGVTINTD
jgi:hypothetical protein